MRKTDLNLTSRNSDILGNNVIFTQKKVKPLELNPLEEPAIKVFVTPRRNEIGDMEKGGKGLSKKLPRPVDR